MTLIATKIASIIAYFADEPAMWEGDPGTGKTSFGKQMAHSFEVPEQYYRLSTADRTDIGGHPVAVDDKYIARLPGQEFYELNLWTPPLDRPWAKAIVGLDEINWAPEDVQSGGLEFAQERRIGMMDMKGRVWTWSAYNPGIEGAYMIVSSLANRYVHLPFDPTTQEWLEGEASNWPFPEVPIPGDGVDVAYAARLAQTLSFLKVRPELRQADQDKLSEEEKSGAWPSGRTWVMATRLLATADSCGINGNVNELLVKGSVGKETGAEFLQYVSELDLPDPEDILADPNFADLPTRGDKVYSLVQSVVAVTLNKPTPERKIACWQFLDRCRKGGRGPVAAAHARELAAKSGDVEEEIAEILEGFESLLDVSGLLEGV